MRKLGGDLARGALALLLCACSQRDRAVVAVTLSGLPPDARSVRAKVTLDERPASPVEELRGELTSLGLELPADARGLLRVDLEARDGNPCVVAQGSGALPVEGPRRHELTIPFSLIDGECTPPPLCTARSQGTICWSYPLPQGNQLNAVWGSGPSDVWAAGIAGSLVHWNGKVWSGVQSPTDFQLNALWGSGPSDVWAVGTYSQILHYDGLAWSLRQTPMAGREHLSALWGSGPADVFAAGNSGTILHFDGTRWSNQISSTAQPLYALWGTGPRQVFAVGGSGAILSFDGAQWKAMVSPTQVALYAIWGSGPSDVWAAGTGALLHYDGTSWSAAPGSWSGVNFTALSGSGPKDVWAATSNNRVYRFDGVAWQFFPRQEPWQALFGVGVEDIWAVGAAGTLRHYKGPGALGQDEWPLTLPGGAVNAQPVNVYGLYASGPTDVWAAGVSRIAPRGVLLRHDGVRWTDWGRIAQVPSFSVFYGLWGHKGLDGKDELFAVGLNSQYAAGALRWDGASWRETATPAGAQELYDVWGDGQGTIWAVGKGGTLLRWDGQSWASVSSGTTSALGRVHGSAPNNVWALGEKGTVLRWDGAAWSQVLGSPIPDTLELNAGLSVQGPKDVWIMQATDMSFHLTESGWVKVPLETDAVGEPPYRLYRVWGPRPDDLWAAGFYGGMFHYDGRAWDFRGWSGLDVRAIAGLPGGEDVWFGGGGPSSLSAGIVRYRRP